MNDIIVQFYFSNLKLLDNACLISRLITEYETTKIVDPHLATVIEADLLVIMCEKFLTICESDAIDSEEPTNVSVNNSS